MKRISALVLGLAVWAAVSGSIVMAAAPAAPAVKPQDKYVISFEDGTVGFARAGSGKVTKVQGEVISGLASFLIDSTKSKTEWNEGLNGDYKKQPLEALATYNVEFDYQILTPESEGGYFYAMFRVASTGWGHDQGSVQWTSEKGLTGHVQLTMTLEDFPDYRLLAGNRFKGACVIDNIVIEKE